MGKTLIICEKPTAATKIASALALRRPIKKELNGVAYYEFERDGKKFLVVPALGHLFTLKNKNPIRDYPVFDIDWAPIYEVNKRSERARAFAETIQEVAKEADDFISACDYDIEGSTISYNVLRFLCGEDSLKKAKRMKFSTLTAEDLQRAYEELMPRLDFELIDAGIARHILDWYWGENVSRALSSSVMAAYKRFAKISAGRVQSPLLKILVEREREIQAFKPEPYWVVSLIVELQGQELRAEHTTSRFFDKKEAERVRDACTQKSARISAIHTRQYKQLPPVPFDLGTLQSEAYRCFGYTPMRTQQIAQALYQAALISYPRTSSQKLPSSINYAEILRRLGQVSKSYRKISDQLLSLPELKPNEGNKTDPAHPAIYPTGEAPEEKLTGPNQKIYDLIVRRFFSVFGEPAVKESIRVDLDAGGQTFHLRGRRIIEEGWLAYYGPYGATEEVTLPELSEGQIIAVKQVLFEEKETQPPPRYNPASIIKELEARNLGTKSTRALILQNVYNRGYILGNQISVTELGLAVVDALKQYCPEIVDEGLTAHFEREMEAIQQNGKSKEGVIEEAKVKLVEILNKFRKHEVEIGKVLGEAYKNTRQKQKTIGRCEKCGGQLKIVVSRRTHKRFVGCSNYGKGCNNSYPLPQFGLIVPLDKLCDQCGLPMIQVSRAGLRPYRMCINPTCPSKESWGKKNSKEKEATDGGK
jgi:DNA topoisomerase-1